MDINEDDFIFCDRQLVSAGVLLQETWRKVLRDFLRRNDVPAFDYIKCFYVMKFVYGLSAEESHKIFEKLIPSIVKDLDKMKSWSQRGPEDLDEMKFRRLRGREKLDLFYKLSALGVPSAKISKMLNVSANTITRWKRARGIDLIKAAIEAADPKPDGGKYPQLTDDAKEARKRFRDRFYIIMNDAEDDIRKKRRKMTPANLEKYLNSRWVLEHCAFSRRALSGFISRYNKERPAPH